MAIHIPFPLIPLCSAMFQKEVIEFRWACPASSLAQQGRIEEGLLLASNTPFPLITACNAMFQKEVIEFRIACAVTALECRPRRFDPTR